MTPSELIVKGWKLAHGTTVPLWADFIPPEAQQTFPIAAYIHAGFTDDDGPLSGTPAETERFEIIVQALDRRQCRRIARQAKAAFDDLDDTSLSEASATMAEFTVRRQDGAVMFWETRLEVSLLLWDQTET